MKLRFPIHLFKFSISDIFLLLLQAAPQIMQAATTEQVYSASLQECSRTEKIWNFFGLGLGLNIEGRKSYFLDSMQFPDFCTCKGQVHLKNI